MRYTPKGNRSQAITAVIFLTFSTLTLIGLSLSTQGFTAKTMYAFAGVLFMTAVLIVPRFLLSTYIYCMEDFEITVIRQTAKSQKTVCRLLYTDILSVDDNKRKNRGRIKHNYCVTMFPKQRIYLECCLQNEDETVVLEGDDFLIETLKKYTSTDILND